MKSEAFEYIEVFYKRKRMHSTLGYKYPIEFLNEWNQLQHERLVA